MSKNTLIPADNSADYAAWLISIKTQIRSAHTKVTLAANQGLILLYWQLGREILDRQEKHGWGAKIIEQLANDLRLEFPDMKGLSRSNLMYMRSFAEAWGDGEIVQRVIGQLPWGHNIELLTKLKSSEERIWYARANIENGWTRPVLLLDILLDL